MGRRRVGLAVACLAALLVAGCSGSGPGGGRAAGRGDGQLRVVATTTQVADLAANVGGDRVRVTSLLKPGIDAHDYEPSPADIDALLASEIEAGKTVQAFVDEANANLGEKIVLDRFAQFADGFVTAYMHRTMPDLPPQIGVLVELDKPNAEVARGVAQHIAAFAPKYLSKEDVPAEVVESERRVAEETTRAEGKPEAALPKIVEGRLNGFFKDATLLGQPYALDNKKSVQKVLDEAGVTLKRFARIKVGI